MSDDIEKSSGSEKASDPKQKRLTPDQWREIERHWEYGTMGTKEICAEYSITPQAVAQHMRNSPTVKKNSKIHLNKAAVNAAGGIVPAPAAAIVQSDFEAKKKERIERTKDHIFRSSEANYIIFSRMQKELIAGTRTVESFEKAFKVLRQGETFLQINADNRYKVLDIDNDINEQDLPVLVFEDLTASEIKQIQQGPDDLDAVDLPDEPAEDDVVEEGRPD